MGHNFFGSRQDGWHMGQEAECDCSNPAALGGYNTQSKATGLRQDSLVLCLRPESNWRRHTSQRETWLYGKTKCLIARPY